MTGFKLLLAATALVAVSTAAIAQPYRDGPPPPYRHHYYHRHHYRHLPPPPRRDEGPGPGYGPR